MIWDVNVLGGFKEQQGDQSGKSRAGGEVEDVKESQQVKPDRPLKHFGFCWMKWGVTVCIVLNGRNLIKLGFQETLLLLYKEFTVNVRSEREDGARAEAGSPIKRLLK